MIQKRKIVGGLLAVGAIFGAWFAGLIPNFGTGTSGVGTGTGTGTAIKTDAGAKPATAATKPTDAATKPSATAKPAAEKSKTATAKKSTSEENEAPGKVRNDVQATMPDKLPFLEVFVKGSRYQILQGNEMLYIKPDSILALAKRTTGNEEGVRVRITRYRSAKYVAYSQLYEDLQKAGLKPDEIRMPKELVNDPVAPVATAEPTKA